MRTIIAGSRGIRDLHSTAKRFATHLDAAIRNSGFTITTVISGGAAHGVDRLGKQWAKENRVPVEIYFADWKKHGKAAGVIRNTQMAKEAEALIYLWDGQSPGTRHMISEAKRLGLKVYGEIVAG